MKKAQFSITVTIHDNLATEAVIDGGPEVAMTGEETAAMYASILYVANRSLHNFCDVIAATVDKQAAREFQNLVVRLVAAKALDKTKAENFSLRTFDPEDK